MIPFSMGTRPLKNRLEQPFCATLIESLAGTAHIPYRGSAPASSDFELTKWGQVIKTGGIVGQ